MSEFGSLGAFRYIVNARLVPTGTPGGDVFSAPDTERARRTIAAWPGYTPTPLVALPHLADTLNLADLWFKHEGERFGVGSFKPLGGGYAVARVVARSPTPVTVTCATDGNHGRAVAWAAGRFGCRATVYVAAHVSDGRVAAIQRYGADVRRSRGNHDEAVREAAAAAREAGWHVISETANASDPQIARDVLAGYSTLLEEVAEQIPDPPPTHVFVPAGVGGLAAAAVLATRRRWPERRPRVIVVEAETADCVYRSVEAGRRVAIGGSFDTIMAGLAAGEVSDYAWSVLATGADACLAIPDRAVLYTLRMLDRGGWGDAPLRVGESGVASLAAAGLAAGSPEARRDLGIGPHSRFVCLGTEGVTDEAVYESLLNREDDADRRPPDS